MKNEDLVCVRFGPGSGRDPIHEVPDLSVPAPAPEVAEELAVMRELPPARLCEYDEVECRVRSHSTIRVRRLAYSAPARFIGGLRLRARV